jgi:hypothetical protein
VNSYTPELIAQMFGKPMDCSHLVHYSNGKEIPILVVKCQSNVSPYEDLSINEQRAATAIDHMNASVGLLSSRLDLQGAVIGLEIHIGVLIEYSEVYLEIIKSVTAVGVKVTFFVNFSGEIFDRTDSVLETVITQMIQNGADFAIDKIETAEDFKSVEYIFELISKVRINKTMDMELVNHLVDKDIKAIQDIS